MQAANQMHPSALCVTPASDRGLACGRLPGAKPQRGRQTP